ncbi:MAG: transcription antitermination protein NusB [Cyanobacteriota/Melainabacteria group bacterium]|nr:hypothetical protein [Cyanobacteria bacterium HKST-UBA01]MCB9467729.1 hypothetical protein [Candidatus Obscuribacterales bacterium]
MKPRRVARELAVIVLSQMPRKKEKIENLEIENLLTTSIESLTGHAKQLLDESASELLKASGELDEFELDHPRNVKRVHQIRSVNVSTEFLREHLSRINTALALVSEAIVIPELTLAFNAGMQSEVRDFAVQLISTYVTNKALVEKVTASMKSNWRHDRMMSLDREILNLAVTELFFMPDIPLAVCVNEAVELCHRFADDRAAKFLNGVLGDLVEEAEYFRQTGELKSVPDSSTVSKTSEESIS